MRNNSVVGGTILIIIGLYFFLRQLNIPLMDQLFSWQFILIILGLIFIISSLSNRKNKGSIFPGIILLGLGIHFLGQELVANWPHHWAVYTFIVSLAFFGQYLFTGEKGGLFPGVILLAVTLFSTVFQDVLYSIDWGNWWPVVLIAIGVISILRSFRR